MNKWDKKFINIAKEVASWSKDQSTQCGAVIVNTEDIPSIVKTGYNGIPIGVNDNISERHERPNKYKYYEHSERNAIYLAARSGVSTKDCSIYIFTYPNKLFCCSDCARAIIQSGIKRVVINTPDWDNPRWAEDCKIAKEMFEEVNIKIEYYE